MKKWHGMVVATATLLMISSPAWGFFQVDKEAAPPGTHCGGSRVEQLGAGTVGVIHGSGAGVPVGEAATVLAPNTWSVDVSKNVTNQPISWKPGEGWVQALTGNAPPDLCFAVDWRNQLLVVSRRQISQQMLQHEIALREARLKRVAKEKAKRKALVARKAQVHKDLLASNGTRPGRDGTGAAPDPAPPARSHGYVYVLTPGPSMDKELQQWAKKAGWTLLWQTPQGYPVVAPAAFGTNFRKAVQRVMRVMHADNDHIEARSYSNRVMIIKEGD